MKRIIIIAILILVVTSLYSTESFAQCAMCKSVASSNKDAGGSIANGLNDGILYLMAIPYLLLSALGVYLFRHRLVKVFPKLKSVFGES
jgi:hypothetical protein